MTVNIELKHRIAQDKMRNLFVSIAHTLRESDFLWTVKTKAGVEWDVYHFDLNKPGEKPIIGQIAVRINDKDQAEFGCLVVDRGLGRASQQDIIKHLEAEPLHS